MCQYSSEDGFPNDWHRVHLGSRAVGGAAVVFTEATAVLAEGRITPWDAGIWNDAQAESWAGIAAFIERSGAIPGMQLAHAGRKASTDVAWRRGGFLGPAEGGWEPVAPSALPFNPASPPPHALDVAGLRASRGWIRRRRRTGRAGGFPDRRDPCRSRLPPARVPVAAREPAHRRVRRQLRQSHPAPAGGRRGHARRVARGAAAVGEDLCDGLGSRGLGHRRERRAGAAPSGARVSI